MNTSSCKTFIVYYVDVLLLIETVMSLRISCESLQGFRERFQLLTLNTLNDVLSPSDTFSVSVKQWTVCLHETLQFESSHQPKLVSSSKMTVRLFPRQLLHSVSK